MWERFSFYGMRALLVLYIIKDYMESVENNEEIIIYCDSEYTIRWCKDYGEKCVSQNFFGYSMRQMRRWKNTRLNLW